MALTRGHMGIHPCPKCLIFRESLSDGAAVLKMRTSKGTRKALNKARTLDAKNIDDFLQAYGLRNVDVRYLLVPTERLLTPSLRIRTASSRLVIPISIVLLVSILFTQTMRASGESTSRAHSTTK